MQTRDVPQIKLAKVGKDRERKKGGLPWWLGGKGAPSSFAGATGGAGAGGAGGLAGGLSPALVALIPKLAIATMISAVAGGAWLFGKATMPVSARHHRPRAFANAAEEKARDYAESEKKDLPTEAAAPSGLSMVSGSLGGGSAGQAPAAGDAGKTGDASAADQAGAAGQGDAAGQAAAAPPVDPAALAAAAGKAGAAGSAKNPFGNKIGALSSSMGSLGGAGQTMLSGGGGLFGGVGSHFAGPKLGEGLKAFAAAARPSRTTARARAGGAGHTRGLASSQLNNAFRGSKAAAHSGGDNASYLAAQPFDNGMATDKMISDPGGATTQGSPTAHPSGGSSPASGGGGGGGTQNGPTNAGTTDSGLNNPGQDDCTQLLDSSFGNQSVKYVNSPSGGCVIDYSSEQNVSPWKEAANIGQLMLTLAGVCLLIAGIIGMIAKSTPWTAALYGIAKWIAYIAMVLAGIATICGIVMMAQGNPWGGLLLTGMGALTTYLSYRAADDMSTQQQQAAGQASHQATANNQVSQALNKTQPPPNPAAPAASGPPSVDPGSVQPGETVTTTSNPGGGWTQTITNNGSPSIPQGTQWAGPDGPTQWGGGGTPS